MNHIIEWVLQNKWYFLFALWGLPLGYYRSKFRKKVYQTDSWTINIKPYFWKETKALFGAFYPQDPQDPRDPQDPQDTRDPEYIKFRNFYRLYILVYLTLFIVWAKPYSLFL